MSSPGAGGPPIDMQSTQDTTTTTGEAVRFRATLEQHGRTATGIEVPAEVVAALGTSRRPAVHVTLGDHAYRSTVAARGGRFLVPVSAEHRAAAGVAAGDELDVTLVLDTAPREVEVPADLAAALDAEPDLRRRFDALAPSRRGAYVTGVEGARTAETRARRVAKAVADLADGA